MPKKIFIVILVATSIACILLLSLWFSKQTIAAAPTPQTPQQKPPPVVEKQLRPIKYYRVKENLDYVHPSLDANKAMLTAAEGMMVKAPSYNECEFLLFESLNRIDYLLYRADIPASTRFVYGLRGTDAMASKSFLTTILRKKLPSDVVKQILPETYVLDSKADTQRLMTNLQRLCAERAILIFKSNVQQQKGFAILQACKQNSIKHLLKTNTSKFPYVVCQKMLQNPLIVNGRKINMRMYMLIVVKDHACEFYIYDDGFIYYTPGMFKSGSTNVKEVITTGYIDRAVYDNNPLTFTDLSRHIGADKYHTLEANMFKLAKYLKTAFHDILVKENYAYAPGTVRFLVYGVDVAPSASLNAQIMEINKGPDLMFKDDRDKHVKLNMVKEMLSLVGVLNNGGGNSGQFRKVI